MQTRPRPKRPLRRPRPRHRRRASATRAFHRPAQPPSPPPRANGRACPVTDGARLLDCALAPGVALPVAPLTAKDLGLTNKTPNGWVFWRVTKVARPAGDPLEALGRAWERYQERATSVVGGVKGDDRARIRELIDQDAEVMKELRGRVA